VAYQQQKMSIAEKEWSQKEKEWSQKEKESQAWHQSRIIIQREEHAKALESAILAQDQEWAKIRQQASEAESLWSEKLQSCQSQHLAELENLRRCQKDELADKHHKYAAALKTKKMEFDATIKGKEAAVTAMAAALGAKDEEHAASLAALSVKITGGRTNTRHTQADRIPGDDINDQEAGASEISSPQNAEGSKLAPKGPCTPSRLKRPQRLCEGSPLQRLISVFENQRAASSRASTDSTVDTVVPSNEQEENGFSDKLCSTPAKMHGQPTEGLDIGVEVVEKKTAEGMSPKNEQTPRKNRSSATSVVAAAVAWKVDFHLNCNVKSLTLSISHLSSTRH
jgi:hypothetical protein